MTGTVARPTSQDDTTRYLCAAAHLDPEYADDAIREFLVEPTRPVPPSPGLDAGRVLTEAAVARVWRKVRDGLLALLMLGFVVTSWDNPIFYGWIVLAVLLMLVALARGVPGRHPRSRSVKIFVAGALLLVLLYFLFGNGEEVFEDLTGGSFGSSRYESYLEEQTGGTSVNTVFAWILGVAMLALLVFERWASWRLLTTRFGRHVPAPPPAEQSTLYSLVPERFRNQLARYREENPGVPPGSGAPLVVYRGYHPFVGSGLRRQPWSMAVPLEPLDTESKEDGSAFEKLTTVSLYEGVSRAIAELRSSTALSPDLRLHGLSIENAVFAPADELIYHRNEPDAVAYLPDLDHAPRRFLPPDEVDRLRRGPKEWARYYLCFQVETWNRDLVLSAYLHAAMDTTTLYLEWTPCLLRPIKDVYRAVDRMAAGSAVPFGQGVLEFLKLPATIPARLGHALSVIRPLPHEGGVIDPDRYGSLNSLRELAAAGDVRHYLHQLDVERYDKILESRLLPAISRLLREAGYSPAGFEQRASMVVNNDVNIHGNNYGAFNVGGTTHGPMSGATSAATKGTTT
ncbi:hypothetical protein [Amycolatopsis nigrescens]|uniref:hypothetical protein n=1 Tax=Amycolatopsis nigrescens TaxID=381445 RepID=UPI00036CD00B|nr:hypothetical protein [Amycolatopsis nigrescens]